MADEKVVWKSSGLVTRVDSGSRFAIFLARIVWKLRLASRENIIASLARREKCDILRDSQTSKIIIHGKKLAIFLIIMRYGP
jgi:hypothetical protein